MLTLRHIGRLFSDQKHSKLYRQLVEGRPEADAALDAVLARAVPVAALGVIRLEELNQSHTPLYRRLLNVVLTSQQPGGGWDDPMTTALCVRALLASDPTSRAAACGIAFLATLQQDDGAWPREPLRRMPADALASAYILLQLSDKSVFRSAVRFDDAMAWFITNTPTLDPATQRVYLHAAARCRGVTARPAPATLWTQKRSAA